MQRVRVDSAAQSDSFPYAAKTSPTDQQRVCPFVPPTFEAWTPSRHFKHPN
jgi:hypothetical protein